MLLCQLDFKNLSKYANAFRQKIRNFDLTYFINYGIILNTDCNLIDKYKLAGDLYEFLN